MYQPRDFTRLKTSWYPNVNLIKYISHFRYTRMLHKCYGYSPLLAGRIVSRLLAHSLAHSLTPSTRWWEDDHRVIMGSVNINNDSILGVERVWIWLSKAKWNSDSSDQTIYGIYTARIISSNVTSYNPSITHIVFSISLRDLAFAASLELHAKPQWIKQHRIHACSAQQQRECNVFDCVVMIGPETYLE